MALRDILYRQVSALRKRICDQRRRPLRSVLVVLPGLAMRLYVSEGRLLKSDLPGFFRMELGCDFLALSDRINPCKDVRFGLSGTFSCLGTPRSFPAC